MNKTVFIFFFFFFCAGFLPVCGQYALKRQILNTTGNAWEGSAVSIQYSVGGLFTDANYLGNRHVTPGFLQPVSKKNETGEGILINAFPNPVSNTLKVKIITDTPGFYSIEVQDIGGKLVLSSNPLFVEDYLLDDIDFSTLSNGLYLLHVKGKRGAYQKTIKISKIH